MRLRADLILLLVALIWGSTFAVQRVAAGSVGPFLYNFSRFGVSLLVLLPLTRFHVRLDYKMLPVVGLAGVLLFIASFLQQAGLSYTTAGNAGFITGLYVVIVPMVLVIVLRQRVGWSTWAAALIATLGALLLSTGGELKFNPGDALELAGAIPWALHVILIGWVARRVEILSFVFGQNLVSAVLNLAAMLVFDVGTVPGLADAGWAVVYSGIFSIGIGFALQAVGQRHAPPADAALILSMEAVFAAVFGFFWLDEQLSGVQLAGCGLILAMIIWVQLRSPAAASSIFPQTNQENLEKAPGGND